MPVDKTHLETAVLETRRFLERARAMMDHLEEDDHGSASAAGGAVRRASMDLSRALAALRK